MLGILGRSGAFAEELVLPTSNLLPVPDGVSDAAATFVEPLAAARSETGDWGSCAVLRCSSRAPTFTSRVGTPTVWTAWVCR